MREIPLSRGLVAIVDDEDYEMLVRHRWYATPQRSTFYAQCRISTGQGEPKTVLMHRLVIQATPGQKVDHKDGNGLMNTRSNLRVATTAQNTAHQTKLMSTNKSGYRGVRWSRKHRAWYAELRHNGRGIHLGHFDDPIDAAKAYDRAAVAIWGEFASPNFEQVPA